MRVWTPYIGAFSIPSSEVLFYQEKKEEGRAKAMREDPALLLGHVFLTHRAL